MTDGLKIVVVPVKDLDAGKAFYSALLGVEPMQDAPYYVGYETAGIHLGLNPHGHEQGLTGPTDYWTGRRPGGHARLARRGRRHACCRTRPRSAPAGRSRRSPTPTAT